MSDQKDQVNTADNVGSDLPAAAAGMKLSTLMNMRSFAN